MTAAARREGPLVCSVLPYHRPELRDTGVLMNTSVICAAASGARRRSCKPRRRSSQVGDEEMSDDIRWIRSYVLPESEGGLGTVCIYQASSPEKIREHATRADLP